MLLFLSHTLPTVIHEEQATAIKKINKNLLIHTQGFARILKHLCTPSTYIEMLRRHLYIMKSKWSCFLSSYSSLYFAIFHLFVLFTLSCCSPLIHRILILLLLSVLCSVADSVTYRQTQIPLILKNKCHTLQFTKWFTQDLLKEVCMEKCCYQQPCDKWSTRYKLSQKFRKDEVCLSYSG